MEIEASSHGIGGSHTKWQRKPPAHGTYRLTDDKGNTLKVTAWFENGEIVKTDSEDRMDDEHVEELEQWINQNDEFFESSEARNQ